MQLGRPLAGQARTQPMSPPPTPVAQGLAGQRGGDGAGLGPPAGGNCAHAPPFLDPPPPNETVDKEQCTRGKYGRDKPETTV